MEEKLERKMGLVLKEYYRKPVYIEEEKQEAPDTQIGPSNHF